MIALDGVYTVGKSGKAKFHRVKAPNQTELRTLLNRVIQRVVRCDLGGPLCDLVVAIKDGIYSR